MDTPRNTAEKVRPILQAMERSIDSARSRRMQGGNVPNRELTPGTPGAPGASRTNGTPGFSTTPGTPAMPGARPMMPPLATPVPLSSGMSQPTSTDTSMTTNGVGDPIDPDQPSRLKARAKARPKPPAGTINGSPPTFLP